MKKLTALYRLSRVGTIMDSFPMLMALAIIAARRQVDLTTVLIIGLNLLILIFAYMINDIEDAEDDKHDAHKAARNPVASGALSYFEAYLATAIVVVLSLVLLIPFGLPVFLVGASILVVGYLYSGKYARFKSRRLIDVISHGYFLAAAQVFLFALLPGATFDGYTLLMALGVYVFSIGGDLYNECRDWAVDQKAGLKNTADLLGYKLARTVNYGFWVAGVLLIAGTCLAIILPRVSGS